jgi:hypothetical protein
MKFVLLIFSFVAKQFLHRTVLTNELSKSKNIYDGYDHRYLITNETLCSNETTLEDTHSNIITMGYFYKLKLLKKLTNPEISEPEKLAEIERYEGYNNNSKYNVDLTAGGLYKDWETTIS